MDPPTGGDRSRHERKGTGEQQGGTNRDERSEEIDVRYDAIIIPIPTCFECPPLSWLDSSVSSLCAAERMTLDKKKRECMLE
jgi:hypothetical protein